MDYKRYGLIILASVIGLQILSMIVFWVFNFDISNAGMAILPPMVGAMIEGQKWARQHGRGPDSKDIWRWSSLGGMIVFVVYIVGFVVIGVFIPEIRSILSEPDMAGLMLVLLAALSGFAILVNRWFYGIAVRSELARMKQ